MAKARLALLILLISIQISNAVDVQITVFCNGDPVYDNGVSVGGASPTALDAIKASGVSYTGFDSSYGYYLTSIAGCGGDWGPSFMVNGAPSPLGVSGYQVSDGDHLIFLGPNSASGAAKYLFLADVPDHVEKDGEFRVRVMEQDGYGFTPAAPSTGAEVDVGNNSVETDGNGYTPEMTLDLDAFFCVAATKSGCVASYYFSSPPYIQCGVGGPYICSIQGISGKKAKGNIKYDESSSVSGVGFSSCRSHFENNFGGALPARSTDLYQQGSGSYSSEKTVRMRPSGIDMAESTEMRYGPTKAQAYSRPLNYASKYEDSTSQKNYNKGAFFDEKYSNLDYLKRQNLYNNSGKINFSLESDFHGSAELQSLTQDKNAYLQGNKKSGIVSEEFLDTFIGDFQISMRGVVPAVNETRPHENYSNTTYSDAWLPCCSEGETDTDTTDGSCPLCRGGV